MVKARGQVTRSTTPKEAVFGPLGEPEIKIVAWCPDSEAKMPPEQVHLVNIIPGLEEFPIIMRFKSPDTLGFLIEELIKYRREVWPDAEPINREAAYNNQIAGEEEITENDQEKILFSNIDGIPPGGEWGKSSSLDTYRRVGLRLVNLGMTVGDITKLLRDLYYTGHEELAYRREVDGSAEQ